ncbi:MAG: bifunctional metallophosphatase/5'-nucleotidase [Bacteroidetes bacterium 4572_117]|nr:MAG: bifunctional metallophosphatase/5'-nucleotidase [Bacteroidetes bacterium 4572_117]
MTLKKFLFTIIVVTGLLFSCNTKPKRAKNVKLRMIQTTDVHGSIFPYDFIRNKETNNSLASVYTYVQKQRANKDIETILLDNGDILQGQPVVYYSNFESADNEHICASVMNFMGYDAATIGNHDIEAGHEVYDKINKEFKFPWLAANAIDKKTREPYFKAYTIINRKGLKIAVLGLITPAIPNWLPENIWEGIKFEDMVVSAKKWIKIIKKNEKPDLIVGMFHSGVDFTYGNQTDTTFKNENATRLVAEQVPGFDIVFAGHDHQEYNLWFKSSDSSDVLLLDPRSYAKYVAVADIEFTWNKNQDKYDKIIKGDIVKTENIEADSTFLAKFEEYVEEVKNYVNHEIGFISKSISSRKALFGNSEFVDLIHKIQLEISGADISFTAPLNYDAEIKSGPVYVRDMFNLYRFENLLYTMNLNGNEIKDYLEFSTDLWFNEMTSENDNLIKMKKTHDGKQRLASAYYNFSSAAGIDYSINLKGEKGNRVNITGLSNGDKFELAKKYTVAINSYRGNGGGGHLIEGAGILKSQLAARIITSTDKDLRYYMIKWIEKNKTITPEKYDNWQLTPKKWWEKAKAKDIKILFPD